MNRQKVLLGILVFLALFGLPVTYMDKVMAESKAKLAAATQELEPFRQQAAALRQREAKVAAREAALSGIQSRLITRDPFATIAGELAAVAKSTGVTIGNLGLEGPSELPDLHGVVRYQAVVQVSGTRAQYLDFLRLLETHRLFIEIPEASLRLQPPALKGGQPRVDQVVTLGFFGAAKQ